MRKPLIGITSGLRDDENYYVICKQFFDVLEAAGTMPVLLPLTADEALLRHYAQALDGFLFSGGGDVDPMLFGEYQLPECGSISPLRDAHELSLAHLLLERGDKPMLGICRGFQVLNIALGGDVYQDLSSQYEGRLIAHRQKQLSTYASHPVAVEKDSLLHCITGEEKLMVNSLHHQAVRKLGAWQRCAVAPDGVVEAAEMQDHPFLLGVQWHPERLWTNDGASFKIFKAFAHACAPAKIDIK